MNELVSVGGVCFVAGTPELAESANLSDKSDRSDASDKLELTPAALDAGITVTVNGGIRRNYES